MMAVGLDSVYSFNKTNDRLLNNYKINFCLLCILAIAAFSDSCNKNENTIDVSNIYTVDDVGNAIGPYVLDGQWENKTFTVKEQSLFNDLDTARLSGTVTPDSVLHSNWLPNPFSSVANIFLQFSSGYSGENVFKYVIVDDRMNMIDRGAMRISGNPAFANLSPVLPSGKFRIYFTLSTKAAPDFYESWGNIQKTN